MRGGQSLRQIAEHLGAGRQEPFIQIRQSQALWRSFC
jgi:hypothetical protein